jgi:hypothetical protein
MKHFENNKINEAFFRNRLNFYLNISSDGLVLPEVSEIQCIAK